MTAVVGILNKQAVAIAADSAVTIGGNGGRKIFNKANKVFSLSKYHPVGIMIYNSAEFMSTPWETIIKIYRKQLGSKFFNTIKEYQNDFIEFIRLNNFYSNEHIQLRFLESFSMNIIHSWFNQIRDENKIVIDSQSVDGNSKLLVLLEKEIDKTIDVWKEKNDYYPEFSNYTIEDFESYSNLLFDNIKNVNFIRNNINISDELMIKIKEAIYYILTNKEEISTFTGLIFTGFGENEVFPQLLSINISIVIDNKLRYYEEEHKRCSISIDNPGGIRPYAQTDVIDTILTGIDPILENLYLNNFKSIFDGYNKEILNLIGDSNPLLSSQIQMLDTNIVLQDFNLLNQQIKTEKYINPLINAVSSLAKDDLAEMAESLIYLTYLKRRITFAEESVGGPVDVAIISKGDGFVWVKRKHYFRPELNQHFFDNYFKK